MRDTLYQVVLGLVSASNIIGWFAWALDVYLAISFTLGARMCAKRGQQFQWLTALQTTIFWVVALLFALLPLPKVHIVWILLLTYLHLIALWLVNHRFLPAIVLYIPFPVPVLLRVPLTKFVILLFMQPVLLGARSPVIDTTVNSEGESRMGLSQFVARWTIRGIARTQFRLFRLTQEKNPGISETIIAPLMFARRMKRGVYPRGQDERVAVYLRVNGAITTLREACHAIAVIEFKINPLDEENVAYLTSIIDQELDKLGYAEQQVDSSHREGEGE